VVLGDGAAAGVEALGVAGDHLRRPPPPRLHDRDDVEAGGDEVLSHPDATRVTRDALGVDAVPSQRRRRAPGQLLQDRADARGVQPRPDLARHVHRSEERAVRDAGDAEPGAHRRVGPGPEVQRPTPPLCVRLRRRDADRRPTVARRHQVADAQRDELAAPREEVTRDQQQRAVAAVDAPRAEGCEHGADGGFGEARRLALPALPRRDPPADDGAIRGVHLLALRRIRNPEHPVHAGERRQRTLDRRGPPSVGPRVDEGRHVARARWQAPSAADGDTPIPPSPDVGPQRDQ
jgi:hypothetical protein